MDTNIYDPMHNYYEDADVVDKGAGTCCSGLD